MLERKKNWLISREAPTPASRKEVIASIDEKRLKPPCLNVFKR
jgi:hypothetical protein